MVPAAPLGSPSDSPRSDVRQRAGVTGGVVLAEAAGDEVGGVGVVGEAVAAVVVGLAIVADRCDDWWHAPDASNTSSAAVANRPRGTTTNARYRQRPLCQPRFCSRPPK